ncbi:MAG: hypothetical protein GX221_09880 [Candidatus Riflebacteria bacterium]|nr:hypothetical protein [Candidatus Riflebacteria bacterium]
MKKKITAVLFIAICALFTTGCIQEQAFIPSSNIKGKVQVPPGQIPNGIKVTVAGKKGLSAYVDNRGNYSIEVREPGRYLLIAHGMDFEPDYVWVNVELEKETRASDINLAKKVVGEAKWIATIVDFPEAEEFYISPIEPKWTEGKQKMRDDGMSGDNLANDGIFTLKKRNVPSGYQSYEIVYKTKDGKEKKVRDPHEELVYKNNSVTYVHAAPVKQAVGRVLSDLTGINYSEITLSTRKGSRTMKLNSDGTYTFAMEGSGKEYLVFRSDNIHIKAVPVDLTNVFYYEVPDVTVSSKKPGELKVSLIASDFANVTEPKVVGKFTNGEPVALYDNGLHGDDVAGDGVYSRLFTGLLPGYYEYAFDISADRPVKDPYEEQGNEEYSIVRVK